MFTDIINDHGLEQMLHFPTREKITFRMFIPLKNLVILTLSQES